MQEKNTARKPNIILVLTDDQGYGDLGCHGNPVVKTPNIDQFYEESMRFSNFHVGPTCAPTRSGLFTGHYANSTGVWHTVGGRSLLRKDEVTLPSVLLENGYATALFGKWHLGDNYPYRPQDRGFQEVVMHGGGGISQAPDYWGNDYFDDHYYVNGEAKPFKGYCTDVFFNLAFDYIKRQKDHPFFCCITTNAPHSPYNVDRQYSDPYRECVPKDGMEDDRSRFYGMITNIDENFGKLDQLLKDQQISDDTILIFMTDNGTGCGGPGYNTCGLRGYKNSEYDGGHRVPFFMRYSNGAWLEPQEISRLSANIDFMPTLMELSGISLEDYKHCRFDGKSLKPFLESENPEWPERSIVTDSQRVVNPIKWRKSAVMTDRWRLINGTELYDINEDRGQEKDIAKDYPEVTEQLKMEYDKWWEKVSVQFEEAIPISIGSDKEKVTRLSSHDWRHLDHPDKDHPANESNSHLVFSQAQIRQGVGENGYYELNVEEERRYRFELHRWPKEEKRALTEGIPVEEAKFEKYFIPEKHYGYYQGGKAMAFTHAWIQIADQKMEKKIPEGAENVSFELDLKKGYCELIGAFTDQADLERGAYYIYVSSV